MVVVPAGVANVIAYETSVLRNAGVRPGDKVLQWMAVNFDLSVLDFWSPLAMGCSVVVAPAEEMKSVERVAALVQQHYIASISVVPSMCQVRASEVLQT
jgi:non-ribosomal peptide synthetase component F